MSLFATNLLDKAESVKLELKTFDEIFGEGWWDKGEAEDLKMPAPTNFGQNVHHQIDRQNTQILQIEPNIAENERKRKIINKFHAMKDEFKQKGNYSTKEWEKFYQRKAELKRAGFKNSYKQEIDETVAKELGLSLATIYRWKKELGQSKPQHSHSEQKELIKRYYKIKDKNSKISDEGISKMLKIGIRTLYKWKKLFIRHQFHPNSVDGHSVEVNVSQINVQEIGNTNSGSI
uniref:Transposase n=1 Tax=Globodera rostochiensis TaxID=31243 RepID=A0A914HQ45_GLORO